MGRGSKKKNTEKVARDLSCTMNRSAGTPSKDPASSPKKTGKGSSKLAKDSNLSETVHCKSSNEIAFVCSSIISDNLGLDATVQIKLTAQLEHYFTTIGVTSDDSLKLFAGNHWPSPSDVVKQEESAIDMLTPAAMLALDEVSRMTAVVRHNQYYLGEFTTHENLVQYCQSKPSHRHETSSASVDQADRSAVAEKKLPSFSLPKFTGTRLDGSEWMKKVVRVFRNHGVGLFLTDNDYPLYYTEWSSAFTARILDAIADSDIMSFLAEKHKEETNCCVVWEKVTAHLTSSDLAMTRMMKHWSEFMGLSCQEFEDFLPFYSKVSKVLEKLRQAKSVAVTDDVFLRAFLGKAISCEELRHEAKRFLQDGKGTHNEILDDILLDYRSQETRRELEDGTNPSKKVRRAETSVARADKRPSGQQRFPRLPTNKGNLIPHSYYIQFKEWYELMVIPEKERSDDVVAKLQRFKWKHTQPKALKDKIRRAEDERGRGGRERGGRYTSSHRSRRSRRRSRSPSYSSSSTESYRRSRRSRHSRQRKRSRSPSLSRSRSRSRGRRSEGKKVDQGTDDHAVTTVSKHHVFFARKKE